MKRRKQSISDEISKANNLVVGFTLIIFILSLAFFVNQSDLGSLGPSQISGYSFLEEVNRESGNQFVEKAAKDYEAHKGTIQQIAKVSNSIGFQDLTTYVNVAQLYVESNYFQDSAVRCEDNYEKKWNSVKSDCANPSSASCRNNPWYAVYQKCSQNMVEYEIQTADGLKKIQKMECDEPIWCKKDRIGGNSCDLMKPSSVASEQYHRVSCSYGLGQIMFPTALDLGYKGKAEILLNDDEQNIEYSLKRFKQSLSTFDDGTRAYEVALVDGIIGYNVGEGNVKKAKAKKGEGFNNYVSELMEPEHRIDYMGRILFYAEVFYDIEVEGTSVDDLDDSEYYVSEVEDDFALEPIEGGAISDFQGSVKSSFRVDVNYPFTEYDYLKQKVSQLLSACTDLQNLDSCIDQQMQKYNLEAVNQKYPLSWKYGDQCLESIPRHKLFANALVECSKSPDSSCVCGNLKQFVNDVNNQNLGSGRPGDLYNLSPTQSSLIVAPGNPSMNQVMNQLSQNSQNSGLVPDVNYIAANTNSQSVAEVEKVLPVVLEGVTSGREFFFDPGTQCLMKSGNSFQIAPCNVKVCSSVPKQTFPFCVTSSRTLEYYNGTSYETKPVDYKFALSFQSQLSGPISYGKYNPDTNTISMSNNLGSKTIHTVVAGVE